MPCLDDNRAFFCFYPDNALRHFMLTVIHSKPFFIIILVAIILNSLTLAVNQPKYSFEESLEWLTVALWYAELVFIAIFSLEMLLKMFALGLILHPTAYLRDGWNVFDLFIVALSIVSLFVPSVGNVSALRTFRVLRPLRTVSHIKQLKKLLNSLFSAMPPVAVNILFLIYFIVFIAILGLQMWAGKLDQRCYWDASQVTDVSARWLKTAVPWGHSTWEIPPDDSIRDVYQLSLPANWNTTSNFTWPSHQLQLDTTMSRRCGGYRHCPQGPFYCHVNLTQFSAWPFSFNTIGEAVFVVFKSMTIDGWNEEMVPTVDSVGAWSITYYLIITILGGYFLVNIFLAILMNEYNIAAQKEEQHELKKKERRRKKADKKASEAQAERERKEEQERRTEEEARQKKLEGEVEGRKRMEAFGLVDDSTIVPEQQTDDNDGVDSQPDETTEVQPFDAPKTQDNEKSASHEDEEETQSDSIPVEHHRPRKEGIIRGRNVNAQHRGQEQKSENNSSSMMKVEDVDAVEEDDTRARQYDQEKLKYVEDDVIDLDPKKRFTVGFHNHNPQSAEEQAEERRKSVVKRTPSTMQNWKRGSIAGTSNFVNLDYKMMGTIQENNPSSSSSSESETEESHKKKQQRNFMKTAAKGWDELSVSSSGTSSSSSSSSNSSTDSLIKTGKAHSLKRAGTLRSLSFKSRPQFGANAAPQQRKNSLALPSNAVHKNKNQIKPPVKKLPPRKQKYNADNGVMIVSDADTGEQAVVHRGDPDDYPTKNAENANNAGEETKIVNILIEYFVEDEENLKSGAASEEGGNGQPDEDEEGDDSKEKEQTCFQIFAYGFVIFMVFITILNVAVIAVDYYGIDPDTEQTLDYISYGCTVLFAIELIIKCLAWGFVKTFKDGYNIFDFILVVISVFEFFFQFQGNNALTALRAFRLLRAFRVFRLARRVSGIYILLAAIAPSVVPAMFVCLLLLVLIYIYSILGMQLFGVHTFGHYRITFGTLWDAALSCFIIIAGDDWGKITAEGMRHSPIAAPFFFISLFAIGNYILLNLFAAVIVDQLDNVTCQEWERMKGEELAEVDNLMPPRMFLPAMDSDNSHQRLVILEEEPPEEEANGESVEENKIMNSGEENDSPSKKPEGKKSNKKNKKSNSNSSSSAFLNVPQGESGGGKSPRSPKSPTSPKIVKIKRKVYGYLAEVVMGGRQVLQDYAFFMFSPTNCLRRGAATLAFCPLFSFISVLVTLTNVGFIAAAHPGISDEQKRVTRYAEYGFVGFYSFEVLLQCFARGVFRPRFEIRRFTDGSAPAGQLEREDMLVSSYFSSNANTLDFIITVFAVLGFFFPFADSIRSFRITRIISRIDSLKVTTVALLRAVPHMIEAFLLSAIFWFIFGILGVQLFKGKYYSCTDPQVLYQHNCYGNFLSLHGPYIGPSSYNLTTPLPSTNASSITLWMRDYAFENQTRIWEPNLANFDHIGWAMFSLFTIATGEDWFLIMFRGMDTTEAGIGPQVNRSWWSSFYFIFFFIIGNFFTLNLLMGVLINFFIRYKKGSDGTILLTDEQRMFLLTKRVLDATMFDYEPPSSDFCLTKLVTVTWNEAWISQEEAEQQVMHPDHQQEEMMGGRDESAGIEMDNTISAPKKEEEEREEGEVVLLVGKRNTLDYHTRVSAIYEKYAPERLADVDATLERYRGKEEALLIAMVKKYGPEPKPKETLKKIAAKEKQTKNNNNNDRKSSSTNLHATAAPAAAKKKKKSRRPFTSSKFMILEEEPIFEIGFGFFNLLNAIALAMHRFPQSEFFDMILSWAHLGFIALFGFEILLRLLGLGFRGFFATHWNRLDFLCIAVAGASIWFTILGRAGYIARTVKIVRIWKIISKGERAQKLFAMLLHGLPSLFNLILLFLIIFFIFGVIGMDMFAKLKYNGPINELNNFQYLHNAFLVLYQVMSTQQWVDFLEACMVEEPECSQEAGNCGTFGAIGYFMIFILVAFFVMLQLAVAIVVEHFGELDSCAENQVVASFAQLPRIWKRLVGRKDRKVSVDCIATTLLLLPRTLTRLPLNPTPHHLFMMMIRLETPIDHARRVEYRDFVHSLLRFVFGIQRRSFVVFNKDLHEDLPDDYAFNLGHVIAARVVWFHWQRYKSLKGHESKGV